MDTDTHRLTGAWFQQTAIPQREVDPRESVFIRGFGLTAAWFQESVFLSGFGLSLVRDKKKPQMDTDTHG
jgi:hypothetical protein